MTKNFKKFFPAAFAGGIIAPMIMKHSIFVNSLGGNGNLTVIVPYFKTFKSFLPLVGSNSSAEDKKVIAAGIQKAYDFGIAIVKAQPGLEDFESDEKIINDPKLADFYQKLEVFNDDVKEMIANPDLVNDYFHDPKLPLKLAKTVIEIIRASKHARQ
jgi:hypothetical protein